MPAYVEFRKQFSKKTLLSIYRAHVSYKGGVGIDRVNRRAFEKDLSFNIDIINRKATAGKYRFTKYKGKLISRGATKIPRLISIPTKRDQLALRALNEVVRNTYFESLSEQFMHKIIDTVKNEYFSGQYDTYLRLDIKDFYPTVKHQALIQTLKAKIRKREILELIEASLRQPTIDGTSDTSNTRKIVGIPQGIAISNVLANIYMQPIDKKHMHKEQYFYQRYVDDILVLCKEEDLERLQQIIREDCDSLGLKIHVESGEDGKTKSGKLENGFTYLGYQFKNDLVTVKDTSVDKLRTSLVKIFTQHKYSKTKNMEHLRWVMNLRISGCIFNKTRYGWVFFFSKINDIELLFKLDVFVKKLCERFEISPDSLKPKRFVRSFYEITKNLRESNYIPNFDTYSIEQKRRVLESVFRFRMIEKLDDTEITHIFNRRIYKDLRDLEKDLARGS